MSLLLLKLLLTPLLMSGCIFVGRRWGDRAGGLLLGLPCISGPVSVLLFLQHGRSFAMAAAHSTLVGFVAGGAFCASYAILTTRRPWQQALPVSLLVFLATAWVIEPLELDWVRSGLLVLGTLALLARSVSRPRTGEVRRPPRKRDLALQVLIAGSVVAVLTTWAGSLGSHLAGLLATVPAMSGVMATTAVRRAGRGAANEMLRGAVIGSWGGAAFFTVVGALLSASGPVAAYSAATAAALLGGLAGSRLHA